MRALLPALLALAVAAPASATTVIQAYGNPWLVASSSAQLGFNVHFSGPVRLGPSLYHPLTGAYLGGIDGIVFGRDPIDGFDFWNRNGLQGCGLFVPAWQSMGRGAWGTCRPVRIENGVNALTPRYPLLAALRTRFDPQGVFSERLVDWIMGRRSPHLFSPDQVTIFGSNTIFDPPRPLFSTLTMINPPELPELTGSTSEDPFGEGAPLFGAISEDPLGGGSLGSGSFAVPEPGTAALLGLGLALLASRSRRG